MCDPTMLSHLPTKVGGHEFFASTWPKVYTKLRIPSSVTYIASTSNALPASLVVKCSNGE